VNRVAAEIRADLVVIGTHGRSMLERALLGSVAERVIRTSRIPIVVVPAPAPASRN
jgi:nucleotide-binding universal stress UspA family protein